MNPELLTGVIAALALLGQGANLYLFLRIRVAQLETERRILDKVREDFTPRPECALLRAACSVLCDHQVRHAAD